MLCGLALLLLLLLPLPPLPLPPFDLLPSPSLSLQNHMDPLEYALSKLRRTQRPERRELGHLLDELRALPVTVEEEAALERLLVKCDRWAVSFMGCLGVIIWDARMV